MNRKEARQKIHDIKYSFAKQTEVINGYIVEEFDFVALVNLAGEKIVSFDGTKYEVHLWKIQSDYDPLTDTEVCTRVVELHPQFPEFLEAAERFAISSQEDASLAKWGAAKIEFMPQEPSGDVAHRLLLVDE